MAGSTNSFLLRSGFCSHADRFPEEDFLKHALRVISGWIGNGALKVMQATKITLDWGLEQTYQHSESLWLADGVTQSWRSWEAREEEETQPDIQFHTSRAKNTSQTHVLHYYKLCKPPVPQNARSCAVCRTGKSQMLLMISSVCTEDLPDGIRDRTQTSSCSYCWLFRQTGWRKCQRVTHYWYLQPFPTSGLKNKAIFTLLI